MIAGAIIASRPPGYVVYQGYSQPVYGPGCYWASEPLYDGLGRVVGYTGRPVQVCPGYIPPPPPAPGYAGPPPAPPRVLLSFRQNEAPPMYAACLRVFLPGLKAFSRRFRPIRRRWRPDNSPSEQGLTIVPTVTKC